MANTETKTRTTSIKLALSLGGLAVAALALAVVQFSGGRILKQPARSTAITCPTVTDAPSVLAIRDPEKDSLQIALADGASREIAQLVRQGRFTITDAQTRTRLGELVAKRKQALIATIVANPSQALQATLAPNEAGVLEQSTKNCLERQTSVEGNLQVTHADFDDGSSANEYTIMTDAGEKLLLYPTNLSHNLHSGMQIRVSGLRLDNHLLVDDSNDDALSTPFSGQQGIEIIRDTVAAVTGEQKLLVLYFDFNDTTPLPTCPGGPPCLDQNTIYDQLMNPNLSSTNVFLQEASFGPPPPGVWLNGVNNPLAGQGKPGDIYPVTGAPYELPISRSCGLSTVVQAAMNRAEAVEGEAAIDFTRYTHVMAIGPMLNCGASGMAYVGTAPTQTPDGVVTLGINWIARISALQKIMSHELGHNFGNGHAAWWDCGNAPLIGTCTRDEYGDNYDAMGSRSAHFNAYHKEIPGWLTAGPAATHEILTVTQQTGVYELSPIETNVPGLKALKIPRHASLEAYLYVEYRQPIGFDTAFPANLFEGGLLHLRISSRPYYSDLFDPTASTSEPANVNAPTLPVGFVHPDTGEPGFVDPVSGTRVRVLANNRDLAHPENSRLRVEVTLGTDFQAPNVAITQPAVDATVSGAVDVRATVTDNAEVDRVEFSVSGGGFSQIATVTDPISGDVYGATLDTSRLPNGTANVYVRAWDGVGNERAVGRRVFIANIDNQSPSVMITAPTNGAIVTTNPVPFAADASDVVGIWKVEFYLGSATTPFLVDTSSPFSGSLYVAPGTIMLRARAYDFVGNTAEHAVTFTLPDTAPPQVYITAPSPGTTISGITNFRIGAFDNVGVTWIELYREGRSRPIFGRPPQVQSTVIAVDTRTLQDGNTVFYAKAYDAARNSRESQRITLNVTNTEEPPPRPIPPEEWVP